MTSDPQKPTEKARRAAAVALQNAGKGDAPTITASGYGKIAEQILEIAFANGVKVRQDKDLAEMLAAIELESEIPTEALIAVAEILSYVYKVNGSVKRDSDDDVQNK